MIDPFEQTMNRYYFHAPGWPFCVLVETDGNEFDAIADVTGVLPDEAAPYQNPGCKTLTGKPIITLSQFKEEANQ